jgi:hypothetical protein
VNTRNVHTWKAVSALVVSTMLVLTTLSASPARVVLAANTGWLSPSSDAADTGGDGDGFETNPTGAYADGGGYAESTDTCGPGSPCTERHRFYDYGLSIPADAVIQGIEVRADWWLNGTQGTNSLAVDLSWDGGSSWTGLQTDTIEATIERTVILGGAGETWGRTWSPSDFTNANFRVRVNIAPSVANVRDFRLDWIAVQVTYNQSPNAPTNQTPTSDAFTASDNPQFTWSAFSDPNTGDTQTSLQVQLRTQAGTYGGAGSRDSGTVASAASTYTPGAWNLANGTYCWHVHVQDNSGASNAWSAYSIDTCFTVDRTAPASAATSPAYDNGGSIAVDWTASDNAGGSGVANVVLWYRLDAGTWTDSGLSQAGDSGTFAFSPPGGTNGTYDFQTIAADVAGNVEAGPAGSGDASTVYDTTPPTSQATPPAGPIYAAPIAAPWTADGAVSGIATDGILLRYNYNGGSYADGPTASGTSGTFDFTPPNGGGTYCFYTIATDNAGNVEAAPGGVNGDGCTIFNTPPAAVDDGYSTPEDTPLTVAAPGVLDNDSDANGDALTAGLDAAGLDGGVLVLDADGSFVYTPTLHFNGVVTFTYHANDGITDSNIATVTITVTPINDAPAFTSTPATNGTVDVDYTYDVTADDVDNAVTDLTITAPTRPGWLTLTDNGDGTATLIGTPIDADIGDHPIVLQVSDGTATTTQPFTITVSAETMYYIYLPTLFKNY